MKEEPDYSEFIPKDLIDEMEMYQKENKSKEKPRFPSSRDIVEAVKNASMLAKGLHPEEFPEIVIKLLKENGLDTRFVTVKRIWRVYQNLVERGIIPDVFGIVVSTKEE